ncbi:hypothetical protein [Deefgea piscis]|uniref:hypothetical protein n=1 Tax=Deefgea piscis TaxID=2739061 RepID=UPI001C7EA711|nr:hypothetical protein [Deefgea piscis]QZA80271.1 hypothetical protein K4H25_12085 [Deefgea piscis]
MSDQAQLTAFQEKFPLDLFSSYNAFEQLAAEWAEQQIQIGTLNYEVAEQRRIQDDMSEEHEQELMSIRTAINWTLTSDGGIDDETTVLMALKDHEVWPGYRIGQQWFYASGDPCTEIPTHWMDIPRHPMDTAP